VYSVVAGRVTSPDGAPVWLRHHRHAGQDEAQTGPTGSYALTVDRVGFDEDDCSFIRLSAVGNPGLQWNDTLVGPIQLGPFGTEPPEDTARVDVVLQPAVSASTPP